MAITILPIEALQELGYDDLIETMTGQEDRPFPKGERLFETASALVTEYTRGSTIPSGLENEAVVRVMGWLYSTAKRDGGIKSQKVDDLSIEFYSSSKNVMRNSGAVYLLSPFIQRRAI